MVATPESDCYLLTATFEIDPWSVQGHIISGTHSYLCSYKYSHVMKFNGGKQLKAILL